MAVSKYGFAGPMGANTIDDKSEATANPGGTLLLLGAGASWFIAILWWGL